MPDHASWMPDRSPTRSLPSWPNRGRHHADRDWRRAGCRLRRSSLQVVYRLGTTLPGWLTSASTRRAGIVTLTDLTRTLIDFGAPGSSVAVDGSPFAVYDARPHRRDGIDAKINSIAALSDAAPIGYIALGLGGAVLFVIMVILGAAGQVRTVPN